MKVAFSARAEADFHEIGDYIARDNPERAGSFIRELRAKCEALADAPLAFIQRTDLRDLRCCPHRNYLILFKVVRREVRVVRVIHAARDVRQLADRGNLNEPRPAYEVSDFEALGFLRLPPSNPHAFPTATAPPSG